MTQAALVPRPTRAWTIAAKGPGPKGAGAGKGMAAGDPGPGGGMGPGPGGRAGTGPGSGGTGPGGGMRPSGGGGTGPGGGPGGSASGDGCTFIETRPWRNSRWWCPASGNLWDDLWCVCPPGPPSPLPGFGGANSRAWTECRQSQVTGVSNTCALQGGQVTGSCSCSIHTKINHPGAPGQDCTSRVLFDQTNAVPGTCGGGGGAGGLFGFKYNPPVTPVLPEPGGYPLFDWHKFAVCLAQGGDIAAGPSPLKVMMVKDCALCSMELTASIVTEGLTAILAIPDCAGCAAFWGGWTVWCLATSLTFVS